MNDFKIIKQGTPPTSYDRQRSCRVGRERVNAIPLSFDIETTNNAETKTAFMYCWQFAISDTVYFGRTWDSFLNFLHFLSEYIPNGKKIVYIHNMGFEMAFLLPRLYAWGILDGIFAKDIHSLLKVNTTLNIEFRDSMMLTNCSLAQLAKQYTKTQKLLGDLDYTIPRNSQTPLTETELNYCINDVLILSEYADILHTTYTRRGEKIPLTSTGIVRKYVKKSAAGYKAARLCPTDIHDYNLVMNWLFRGGYTHANTYQCDKILKNVKSYDLTSAYPAVMLQYKYPSEPFRKADDETMRIVLSRKERYSWYAIIKFNKLNKRTNHVYESSHKIIKAVNAVYENGRLSSAESVIVMLTDVDFQIYKNFYNAESVECIGFWYARKQLLPHFLRDSVIYFYEEKKRLKKVLATFDGSFDERFDLEKQYLNIKGQLNSLYGMCVTRLNLNEITYGANGFEILYNKTDYSEEINRAFLSPFWGVWVTAYVRKIITDKLIQLGDNGCYSDTDSIKLLGNETKIFDDYNTEIAALNKSLYPDNPIVWDMGLFDFEGTYKRAKFLGAKRYAYTTEKNGTEELHMTVAGLPKTTVKQFSNASQMFAEFTDNMIIKGCKTTHAYHGETFAEIDGELMHELGGCYLYPADFTLTLNELFIQQMIEARPILTERK